MARQCQEALMHRGGQHAIARQIGRKRIIQQVADPRLRPQPAKGFPDGGHRVFQSMDQNTRMRRFPHRPAGILPPAHARRKGGAPSDACCSERPRPRVRAEVDARHHRRSRITTTAAGRGCVPGRAALSRDSVSV